ncbi:hypothetical protein T4D_10636 [Trichinella pseudospiralis]|uniref:Uncharacterized protein n=1 Tax=Trichinella pseudospiralis TaxID=6337 RepID=A0A0V1FFL8_TRIPS|nr:hypothetical protein T4D_10636 [Trichinella pseudospiralis]
MPSKKRKRGRMVNTDYSDQEDIPEADSYSPALNENGDFWSISAMRIGIVSLERLNYANLSGGCFTHYVRRRVIFSQNSANDFCREASSLPEVDINELQFKLIHMLAPSGGSRPRGMHDQESRPPSLANKFNVRVAKYKRFQRLFQNNRRKLASHLLDGTFLDQFKGNVDEATAHRQNTLSSRPLLPTIEEAAGSDTPGVSITQPILAEEVARELKAARPSAAGPDGLKMLYLQKLKAADFASLFNIWLAHHNRVCVSDFKAENQVSIQRCINGSIANLVRVAHEYRSGNRDRQGFRIPFLLNSLPSWYGGLQDSKSRLKGNS